MKNKLLISTAFAAFFLLVGVGSSVQGAPPMRACSDQIDNDGDGKIDYPADPGCDSKNDRDEFNAPPVTCPTEVNVRTQFGTGDSAIRAAISKAKSCNAPLYFSTGSYTYSDVLAFDGLKVRGDGDVSVLTTTNKPRMALILRGAGVELRSLKITCPQCELPSGPPTSARLSTGESAAVFIQSGTSNFVVDNVTVDRAGSAGILNWGGHDGRIVNNRVRNTLADAYHNTNGAYNVEVAFNRAENVGDDFFAVVSYGSDPSPSHDINIHDNIGVGQPWGRGIYLSGYNLKAIGNQLTRTHGAAILMESGGTYSTHGAQNVEISNNIIREPDTANIHGANILLVATSSVYAHRMENIYGSNNNSDCRNNKLPVRKIGTYFYNVTVTGFCG